MNPCPKCPYCGETQTYEQATFYPYQTTETRAKRGKWRTVSVTNQHTHCRSCNQRIVWSFRYGSGHISELATGTVHYSWSKP